ncbi:MAG: rod shape-determining protein [Lachnospiraceae bacterium]|nr:rod shape-determining protein [Lachnospiraceae bacterium]
MLNNVFGIDLGTSTICIYNHDKKSFFHEKNMIAIDKRVGVIAYGDSAYEMYEKAPDNIKVTYPLSNGVIADIHNMQTLLKLFISDVSGGNYKNATYYIAVPTDVTEVEKRAFYDLIDEANLRARRIYVVDKAVADAIGLGIDVKNSQGVMVVDVGFNTTEISIISMGGIVISKIIKEGGTSFDDAIRNAVKKEYLLHIGGKSAEKVKMDLEQIKEENGAATVYGRDVASGLPMERSIDTKLLDKALQEYFDVIIDNVKNILERTPPELSADIYRNGLYLTGGGSLVSDLGLQLAKGTGLKVNLAEEAGKTVIQGIAEIIRNKRFRNIAYTIEGMGR